MTVDLLRIIGYNIAAATRETHEKGFIHRDIKLANILLKKDENGKFYDAKLSDFGTARACKDVAETILGT